MESTTDERPTLMDRLLRATRAALRGASGPLAALLIFAVLAFITVFVLWALVAMTEW